MTYQKKTLILTIYPLETRMYVEIDALWNVKWCSLMDRFIWKCGRCHTREEHNSNTQCCGSLEFHKHKILSDLSNAHNPYFDIQLIERRWHNSDNGLGQTRNRDRTKVVHGKLQENILLNISSRQCSALRNYDRGTTPTEVQHALVNNKQKQKQNTNAKGKLGH